MQRSKLQLVGVTALLIACKYEEIYPPEVRDCVYITDNAYTRQDVLDMEREMLESLKFQVTVPTAYHFLTRYLSACEGCGKDVVDACNYYVERTLQEHDMLRYSPSLVSLGAVYLALHNSKRNATREHVEMVDCVYGVLGRYANVGYGKVLEVAKVISKKVAEEPVTASRRQLVAVKKKFASDRFRNVSGGGTVQGCLVGLSACIKM